VIFMVKNIAVIGDSESVKGYGAIGIDAIICNDSDKAAFALKAAVEKDIYAIIYMTEDLFTASEKERVKIAEDPVPAVIPIPGANGCSGAGIRRLSSFVEQAVGSDILFKQ